MPPCPLRRTLSTPAVRSAPYPTSSNLRTPHAHQPRRSLGSDTLTRRVLADLDWWTVQGGQRTPARADAAPGAHGENVPRAGPEDAPAPTAGGAAGLWGGLPPDVDTLAVSWQAYSEPLAEFAALSIAPRTPSRSEATPSPAASPVSARTRSRRRSGAPAPLDLGTPLADAYPEFPGVPAFLFTPSPGPARSQRRARSNLLVRSASASSVEFSTPEGVRRADVFGDMVVNPMRLAPDASSAHPDLFL